MISQWKADEIKRLLGDGKLSQGRIALLLDVSRGAVNAIARGKRRGFVGVVRIEVNVQDGTIQHIRRHVERIEK